MGEYPAAAILDIISGCRDTKPIFHRFKFDILLVHAREFHYNSVSFRIMIKNCIWCDRDPIFFSH